MGKKGSSLYTLKNVTKYKELIKATNRIMNKINKLGGFVIYTGIQKRTNLDSHDSKKLYHSVLKELIKRLDQEFEQLSSSGLIVLDQQEKNVMRGEIVENASMTMYSTSEPRRNIIEPPIEAESHLYQTLQCADWICGIVGRLEYYEVEKDADYEVFHKYFHERLEKISKRSSIRRIA
jgi:hypothetical protein